MDSYLEILISNNSDLKYKINFIGTSESNATLATLYNQNFIEFYI